MNSQCDLHPLATMDGDDCVDCLRMLAQRTLAAEAERKEKK